MKRKEFLSNQPDPTQEFDRNNEFQASDNNVWKGKGLDAIIYESVKILKEKGYDEKGLNGGEPEGMFKNHLKTQLQHLLESDETLIGIHQFQVQNFGFYSDGDDVVRFTFNYDYDPENSSIALKEIEAELKGVSINQSIDLLSDIWTSQDMCNRLKELSMLVQEHDFTMLEGKIFCTIQMEKVRLKNLGYEQNGQLEKKLRAEIVRSFSKGRKTDHFVVKAQRFHSQGEMKVNIYYEFIPDIFQLKLKSIRAELNSQKVEYSNDGTSPIPSLDDLKAFYSKHKNDFSKKLAEHKPGSTLKNRLK